MGYMLAKRIFLLKFEPREGFDFEGLEVRCRSTSIRRYYEIIGLTSGEGFDDKPSHRRALAEAFAEVLISWNLQDEDGDVPATADGLLAQEEFFLVMLFGAWVDAAGSVPAPLASRSDAGEQWEAPSMPMETLSADLVNSLMPS